MCINKSVVLFTCVYVTGVTLAETVREKNPLCSFPLGSLNCTCFTHSLFENASPDLLLDAS